MRSLALAFTLLAISTLADCTSKEQKSANQSATNTTTSKTTTVEPSQATNTATAPANNELPIAPAHGGSATTTTANSSATEQTGMDTSALDAKIVKAEEKAKAKSATAADKLAAAAAYLERADIFYNAGRPTLYKFALRDYRRALRYQPDNQQAREHADLIVSIYQSMGRPVPDLGNEP
jgi:hypothetical protein